MAANLFSFNDLQEKTIRIKAFKALSLYLKEDKIFKQRVFNLLNTIYGTAINLKLVYDQIISYADGTLVNLEEGIGKTFSKRYECCLDIEFWKKVIINDIDNNIIDSLEFEIDMIIDCNKYKANWNTVVSMNINPIDPKLKIIYIYDNVNKCLMFVGIADSVIRASNGSHVLIDENISNIDSEKINKAFMGESIYWCLTPVYCSYGSPTLSPFLEREDVCAIDTFDSYLYFNSGESTVKCINYKYGIRDKFNKTEGFFLMIADMRNPNIVRPYCIVDKETDEIMLWEKLDDVSDPKIIEDIFGGDANLFKNGNFTIYIMSRNHCPKCNHNFTKYVLDEKQTDDFITFKCPKCENEIVFKKKLIDPNSLKSAIMTEEQFKLSNIKYKTIGDYLKSIIVIDKTESSEKKIEYFMNFLNSEHYRNYYDEQILLFISRYTSLLKKTNIVKTTTGTTAYMEYSLHKINSLASHSFRIRCDLLRDDIADSMPVMELLKFIDENYKEFFIYIPKSHVDIPNIEVSRDQLNKIKSE